MAAVKYDGLETAFAFVSSAPPTENAAYISLDTGTIYWTSEFNPLDEEVPDDLETSDRYIAVPHKNDLDLGRNLALRFVTQELPDQADQSAGSSGARALTLASRTCWSRRGCWKSGTTSRPQPPTKRCETGVPKTTSKSSSRIDGPSA